MSSIAKISRVSVEVAGLRPIMFDRYPGDNVTILKPEDKLYLGGKAGDTLILPPENIMSFLTAINTTSAPKLVFPSKVYKTVSQAFAAAVSVEEDEIPFLCKGKPITFSGFDENGRDEKAGVSLKRNVARLPKGVPNPKVRPMLRTPWELKFNLIVMPHDDLNQDLIREVFRKGGIVCGFGTFRPTYGKFEVVKMTFGDYDA